MTIAIVRTCENCSHLEDNSVISPCHDCVNMSKHNHLLDARGTCELCKHDVHETLCEDCLWINGEGFDYWKPKGER